MIRILSTNLAAISPFKPSLLLDGFKYVREEVCVVVAPVVHQHRCNPLQTHTSVNALCRQLNQATVFLALILHENIVPDFKHIWIVHIHQICTLPTTNAIVMNLGGWATWSGITHLPEIVFHVERQDPVIGQILLPDFFGLLIWGHSGLFGVSTVICCIQAAWVPRTLR